ncbi:MAG: hypothetical protein DRP63_10220, partial [Planctomycetota bacterium]
TSLPDATDGVAYSCTVKASGGNAANYSWSISGQPSWLSINSSTGELSGTPPAGSAGTYTFTVEVTDGQQTTNKQFDLVVKQTVPPAADFEATPTYGEASLTVTFTDKSTGTILQWQWDFDNNGTVDSTDQNPSWTYNSPGWYTVKLTVSGPTLSDTCVKEKYILVANDVYYVDGVGGDDANGGTGWSDAFATIGKALSVAGNYDLVLVADATYNGTDLKFDGKKIYLKGVDHNTAGQRPVIDCQSNGRAFYFGSGETEDSVVDNFTIKNGSAGSGGAIYCKDSNPSITNCTLSDNTAAGGYFNDGLGGAIYCKSSSPAITNCAFSNNTVVGIYSLGAAIFCDSSSPTITNCTFSGNSADFSGAIYCWQSSNPTVANCTFVSNSAYNYRGGAISCDGSSPTVTNCTFSGNSASDFGGAIYCRDSSSPSIVNCEFNTNTADDSGGAIFCDSGSPTITNCAFSGNSAGNDGGGIYCDSSSLTVTNSTFSGNSAGTFFGGAIECYSNSSVTLNNCILWGDSASSGAGEVYADSGCTVTLNYCCVDSTGCGGSGTIDDSNNCIHDDPQFVDAANGDYHLKGTSPCIDAGDNSLVPSGVTTDLDGNPRIVSSTVDIGAYEYQP